MLLRLLLAVSGACFGWLLYLGAAWIVQHDSINYRLPHMLSMSAERARAIGPQFWNVAGLILSLPLFIGCARRVASFKRLIALHTIAYLLVVCGLGLVDGLFLVGLFGMIIFIWIGAMFVVAFASTQLTPPDVAANARPAA